VAACAARRRRAQEGWNQAEHEVGPFAALAALKDKLKR